MAAKGIKQPQSCYPPALRKVIALWILVIALPLSAREYRLEFGKEDNWQQFPLRSNVELEKGLRGYYDILVGDQRHFPSKVVDMMLHFDETIPRDARNNWQITENRTVIVAQAARSGDGAAYFSRQNGGITLRAVESPLFNQAGDWGDFSIEFYSYAIQLEEYEQLLLWQSENEPAPSLSGSKIVQKIELVVREERMQWNFINFFSLEDQLLPSLTLYAVDRSPLRRWQHHLLRYRQARGLLEYLIDGQPQAVTYTTENGREGGARYSHIHRPTTQEELHIAPAFSGMLDEFRIVGEWMEPPPLRNYSVASGVIESNIIDLAERYGQLRRIEAQFQTPDQSQVQIEYRTAMERREFVEEDEASWVVVHPDIDIIPSPYLRFLKLRVRLLPDGVGANSPRLSTIGVVIERAVPLSAPRNPIVIENAADKSIELMWQPPFDLQPLGYRIFYGPRPGYYPYRIEVGTPTRYLLPPLKPDSPYYFVIESYLRDYPTLPGSRSEALYVRTSP